MQQFDEEEPPQHWSDWWTEVRKNKFGDLSPPKRFDIQVPTISAHTWAVLDGSNGRLIWGKNEHSKREIASITKTMTSYIALTLLEKLEIDPYSTEITISEFATQIKGTSAQLQPNDTLMLIDLLYGLMLPSGNDAALAIAENLGVYLYFQSKQFKAKVDQLSEENNEVHVQDPIVYFVQEMNKQASKMGLNNTYFTNPHGLPNKLNRSTSYDMGKLCFHSLKIPLLQQIVNKKQHTCRIRNDGVERYMRWENTNKLLDYGFCGIKTGVTTDAGPCLASCFISKKRMYIVVVLNSQSRDDRWSDTCKLIDWATDIYEKS